MNWYLVGALLAGLSALGCVVLFGWIVGRVIEELTVGKNTAKFVAVAFALAGYYVAFAEWLPTPSSLLLAWIAPAVGIAFGLIYALEVAKNYKKELKHFAKLNGMIVLAIGGLVGCTLLLEVAHSAYEKSAEQLNVPAVRSKASAPSKGVVPAKGADR